MSLYSRMYWSASKGRWFMIEELSRFQLIEGYRKLKRQLDAGEKPAGPADGEGLPNDSEVLMYLQQDIERRDLDPAFKGGLRPGDDRLQGEPATAFEVES